MKLVKLLLIATLSLGGLSNTTAIAEPLSKVQQLELAFFHAIRTGDIELVRVFLDAGVDVDFQNNQGYSPLMVAAFRGQEAMADFLLTRNADTCLLDERGNSALMAAIVSAEISIARKLMSYDCDDQTVQTRTRQFAEQFGREELVELMEGIGG